MIYDSNSHLLLDSKVLGKYAQDVIPSLNEADFNFIDENSEINPYTVLDGYAIFETIDSIYDNKYYKLIIETPKNIFEKELYLELNYTKN